MDHALIRLLPGEDRRLRGGSPWVFSNEVKMDDAARRLEPGSVVKLTTVDGRILGVAHFNPRTLIAARMLSRNHEVEVDRGFVEFRLRRALALRMRLFEESSYRLVHAEADGLPGLVVDRFGDVVVYQANTAGMAGLEAEIQDALQKVLKPRAIVARDDGWARDLEGVPATAGLRVGELPDPVMVRENGLDFVIDPLAGQKTGWYFDQRLNRAFAAGLGRGLSVLDVYAFAGGFGLAAAAAGAERVQAVDSSAASLAQATASAGRQGLEANYATTRADAFEFLGSGGKERFGLVVADPPAFVRAKRDKPQGLKGYRKLAKLAAARTTEPGFLCLGCCSHHVSADEFAVAAWAGIREAGRGGRLIHSAGAGPDHPVHPALPETAYLKFLAYALD